jgi:exodeoxyribonuclease-3
VRVATWNINGLRARLDFLKLWLRDRRPDVVGLQELKLPDDRYPHDDLESEGYRSLTHGQKSWNGVAILSRSEARVTQRGLPGQEDFGARLISADIGDLAFTTVYCPNGKHLEHDDYRGKLAWFDALATHLAERSCAGKQAVVCGDFNVCPSDFDSYDPDGLRDEIFHSDEERTRFQRLLDTGFADVYRTLHPDGRDFSWWDYRGGAFHRKQGLRIDFLLANPAALGRIREVTIDREYRKKRDGLTPSDHAPVFADLD